MNYRIGDNGKPRVDFSKKYSFLQIDRITGRKFHCGQTTLFLIENKINNPRQKRMEGRSFTLSLRQDGNYKDIGDYRLTQIPLNKDELISIRNNIDKILDNNTYNEDERQHDNELLGCDKKYEIQYFSGQHYKNGIENGSGHFKTVKGTLINYDSPFTGRFFLENVNGALEIIPMASVVEMREIE